MALALSMAEANKKLQHAHNLYCGDTNINSSSDKDITGLRWSKKQLAFNWHVRSPRISRYKTIFFIQEAEDGGTLYGFFIASFIIEKSL